MRTAAIVIVALTASAHAERAPVITVGATMAVTSSAHSTRDDSELVYGARLTLAFEDAPIAVPPPTMWDSSARLVPELIAGFLSNDVRAEGFAGAGVRAEIQLARNAVQPWRYQRRIALYAAARAKIVGKHQDPGAEFVIGEYILLGHHATRFGWEGGLGVVERPERAPDRATQLEGLLTIYLGW